MAVLAMALTHYSSYLLWLQPAACSPMQPTCNPACYSLHPGCNLATCAHSRSSSSVACYYCYCYYYYYCCYCCYYEYYYYYDSY